MQVAGRRALVVGLGKSGVAAARLLATYGAHVAVADDKGGEALAAALEELKGVPFERHLAGLREEAFRGRDLIVVSPGVPLSTHHLAEARSRGAEVIGEVELAARFVAEPILGVTGTNGKSTTTALTAHLLSAAGKKVFAGGNLGTALSNRGSAHRSDTATENLSAPTPGKADPTSGVTPGFGRVGTVPTTRGHQ